MRTYIDINILGQRGGIQHSQPGRNFIIDRKFPGILNGRMSELEWTSFCDNVDRAIEPIGPLKTQLRREVMCGGVLMFAFFAVLAILVTTRVLSNKMHLFLPPLFILFTIVPAVLSYRRFKLVAMQLSKVMADLEAVCETESDKRSEVSFYVKDESYQTSSRKASTIIYIGCSVGNADDVALSAMEAFFGGGGMNPSIATLVVGGSSMFESLSGNVSSQPNAAQRLADLFESLSGNVSSQPNAAQRLADLEGIKALISEEEYDAKRKEILDSL